LPREATSLGRADRFGAAGLREKGDGETSERL